ncbi:MAG: Gfo/Idh/MocA family oxidoreductase [Acidobacteria bacterium]|nr:Gfo/Idh/MocA family oxidoreductase [Acidobacteriota bacterium]
MNRRTLLRSAAAFPYVAPSTVLGANDRPDIGFIGVGPRASYLLKNDYYSQVRIRAIADCWKQRLQNAVKLRPEGDTWKLYPDYREMLDKEKLDAVFVETPTHARVLIMLHALEAGFDVYGEKPLTLTVEEGRTLVRAVRYHKRVLQTGTQQRSMPINMYASKLVESGKIGKIEKVIVCNFLAPERWTPRAAEPMPEGLDWNQWCNQTELRPYHSQLHRGWARWWDYDAGGLSWGVSGWGTHSLDQVNAALGTSLTGPVKVIPEEPALGQKGKVTLVYANGARVCLEQEIIKDHQQLGAIFVGSKGKLQIIRGDFIADNEQFKKNSPAVIKEGPGEDRWHVQNFFDCIKSRKKPNADVEIGHRSNTVCHLVNFARDLGRTLEWDPAAERFKNDPEANKLLARPRRKGFELPRMG